MLLYSQHQYQSSRYTQVMYHYVMLLSIKLTHLWKLKEIFMNINIFWYVKTFGLNGLYRHAQTNILKVKSSV